MDPVSQGLIGASLAQAVSRNQTVRWAALCGAIGGMAPDLDVFIRSEGDPLLFIEYHRHFTHALAFIPFGGLLVAFVLYGLLRRKLSFALIYLFSTLGFATHGFLDACTSYGTSWFWPFSDFRVAFNIISIIDPVFTVTLLVFVVLSLIFHSSLLARVGLGLGMAYLMFGFWKHSYVADLVGEKAQERGHRIERLLLNPTIGNLILWRSVYQFDGQYYVDAVYAPILGQSIFQEGVQVPVIDKETVFPELSDDSVQREDIRRFSYFSQDFIYIYPGRPHVISDLRYGSLPNDDRSLWGIWVDVNRPMEHARYMHLRDFSSAHYDEFWMMLNGEFGDE